MKGKEWKAIHEVFTRMETLFAQLAGDPEADPMMEGAGATIVRVRKGAREQLEYLRVQLAENLTERETYLVLFPIVIYFDELVQVRYVAAGQAWPTLQGELYQIDDGGVLFYDTLDDVLRKPQTMPLIYEVFYFCINHGFRGRYNDEPVKISEYLEKLREKIPLQEQEIPIEAPEEPLQLRAFGSPAWYYAAAGALCLAGYFMIKFYAANYVKPI